MCWNRWLRGIVVLLGALGAGTGWAAARPTVSQVEKMVIERASAGDDPLNALGSLPASGGSEKARQRFLQELFKDPVFRQATEGWLQSAPLDDEIELFDRWSRRHRLTLAAAIRLLSDAEVELVFRLFLAPIAQRDAADCVRLSEAGAKREELVRAYGVSDAELDKFVVVLKRVYLAALSNQVPPVRPTAEAIMSAEMKLMARVPEAQRDQLIGKLGNSREPDALQDCEIARIMISTLRDLPGDAGLLMRREFISHSLLDGDETEPTGSATVDVKGAVSGKFQPGPVPLEYPIHAARAGIEGTMTVRIWVDESGRATRVKTVSRSFNKASVVLDDGSEIGVDEMFDPNVVAFYKSGRFMQRFKDGNPQAYVVEVPLNWRLTR